MRAGPLRRLSLKEYEESAPHRLSVTERDSLAKHVPDIRIVPVTGLEDTYTLTPGATIGTIDLGTIVVTIAPKLHISRVLFLISYGLERFKWESTNPELLDAPDIFEAVTQVFALQVGYATRAGLLHGYRGIEEAAPVLRGRLRLGEQITRRFGRVPPIEVVYDDFTLDIDENMLLRAALAQLKGMRVGSDRTGRELRRTEAILREVESKHYNSRFLPTIAYTRLNRHYKPAVELAKFILRSISFEPEHGSISVRGFLLNMNDVFEDFIYSSLQEAMHVSKYEFIRKAKGKGLYLDEDREISLEPDLSWWNGTHCRFVGDVKYKTGGKTSPNADLYQALAYSIAADLPRASLIYPDGEHKFSSYHVVYAGKTLMVHGIDLTVPPDQILQQIGDLAVRIMGF